MWLLYFILFIFVFRYIFKLFIVYILPWILKRKIEKMQGSQFGVEPERPEGEVKVEGSAATHQTSKKDGVGEYVDFEEVDK